MATDQTGVTYVYKNVGLPLPIDPTGTAYIYKNVRPPGTAWIVGRVSPRIGDFYGVAYVYKNVT